MTKLVPATGALLEDILDETYGIWGEGLTRRDYARYNAAQLRTTWGRSHLQRVALVDAAGGRTRWLAAAKRYDLTARLDGTERRVLGIGAVFTPPAQRGQRHARHLVEELMEQAARDSVELALLFSEIGPEYYARLGFTPVPIRAVALAIDLGRGGAALLPRSTLRGSLAAPMVHMRSADERDLTAVAEIAARMAGEHRFRLERPAAFIQYSLTKKRLLAGLTPGGARIVEFFVAEEGGQPAAYVILTVSPRGWTIEDCGDRDPTGARVGAMLQALRAREPARGQLRLTAWLPPRFLPPQLTIVEGAAQGPAGDPIMMIRRLGAAPAIDPCLGAADVAYWHGDIF